LSNEPAFAVLAYVRRSGRIESEHFGQAVVCDREGRIAAAFGDPAVAVYLRSAAKPFQAVTCLSLGAGERFGWSDDELAVVCASHSASPEHLARVRAILERSGWTPDDLLCGPHPPLDAAERDSLIRAGRPFHRIHNNCSGKHAGMLAACRVQGWDGATYLDREHPLQRENASTMAAFAGLRGRPLETGVDGCGVPTFYLPLDRLATAYARLGRPEAAPVEYVPHAQRVLTAMRERPLLTAGQGRFTVALAERTGGRVVAKTGAEGLFCAAIPELGLGVAVKVADGGERAHAAATCRILREFLPDLDWREIAAASNPPIRNTRGEPVGEIEAAF
jgi:L-asparaginase II